jgi:HK97 family phage major capsid protein
MSENGGTGLAGSVGGSAGAAGGVDTLLIDIRSGWDAVRGAPGRIDALETEVRELRRTGLGHMSRGLRPRGRVSDECALALTSQFVLLCERSGRLEALAENRSDRDAWLALARRGMGLSTRSALTATDFPLPVVYGGELRELISEYGVARRVLTPYPIGRGTARPPRMGTRPAFASIAMSAAIGEKSPTVSYAQLESHKFGGLVRMPREIEEQSAVDMGQYLARYAGVEFARMEDTVTFLADGSPTFENIKGVVQVATDNAKVVQLATGKTKPSDITLADLRNMRALVNKGALNGRTGAYYIDSTFEVFLPSLKTAQEANLYQRLPDGSAIFDGYPVIWTDVLQPYSTTAQAGKPCVVFGALRFWWLGEHGHPRMDVSDQVFYANDQFGVKFIEEIDVDYMAIDAASALLTAAS